MTADAGPISSWRLERLAASRVLEVVALHGMPDRAVPAWPLAPGDVTRDGAGDPVLLHFAPGRWLAVDLAPAAVPACGTPVDVTGKWQGFRITGAGARRLLASALAIDAVLEGRQCAAVAIFDCPAVMARAPGGFVAWVQASYVAHFLAVTRGLAPGRDAAGPATAGPGSVYPAPAP
jgi:sarcosine oxidase gamma subunit